jgi:hypothetical protein
VFRVSLKSLGRCRLVHLSLSLSYLTNKYVHVAAGDVIARDKGQSIIHCEPLLTGLRLNKARAGAEAGYTASCQVADPGYIVVPSRITR